MLEIENYLSCLRLKLSAEGIDFRKSSDFQGVLFRMMKDDYGSKMHQQQLHPYSQYLSFENDEVYWEVHTTTTEAYMNIIEPLMKDTFDSFQINNGNIEVTVVEKELTKIPYSKLMEEFYNSRAIRTIRLQICSLMSFKQRGRYNVTPDLRLIYQSLMMKYNAVAESEHVVDEETLEYLVDNSYISRYRLRTGTFPLEGQNIPGYIGTLTIKVVGSETMARYARMLFRFGEFSGIGIKTGMGMGAIKMIKEEKKDGGQES